MSRTYSVNCNVCGWQSKKFATTWEADAALRLHGEPCLRERIPSAEDVMKDRLITALDQSLQLAFQNEKLREQVKALEIVVKGQRERLEAVRAGWEAVFPLAEAHPTDQLDLPLDPCE